MKYATQILIMPTSTKETSDKTVLKIDDIYVWNDNLLLYECSKYSKVVLLKGLWAIHFRRDCSFKYVITWK